MEKQKKTDNGKTLGIYGGSFSPVHCGHVIAARAFYNQIKPDRFLIMPAFLPPHKALRGDADAEERCDMCRIAFSDFEDYGKNVFVSDYETEKGGKSYTVDTVRHFLPEWGKIFLLVGTDMFLCFEQWREFEEIMKNTVICCAYRSRDAESREKVAAAAEKYRELYGAKTILIEHSPLDISSSELRERLAGGDRCKGYIPDGVAAYIKQHGLYGNGG